MLQRIERCVKKKKKTLMETQAWLCFEEIDIFNRAGRFFLFKILNAQIHQGVPSPCSPFPLFIQYTIFAQLFM